MTEAADPCSHLYEPSVLVQEGPNPAALEAPASPAGLQAHGLTDFSGTRLPGCLSAFSQWKRQLGVDWPRIQTCLCVFEGFIIVTVSFICAKALSGRVLATF